MSDIIFGFDWTNVVGSLVLITFVFTTVLVVVAGYMYQMLKKIQSSIDRMPLNGNSPDPLRRYTFARPHMNAGYEPEIPRGLRDSSLRDRQPKLGQTFDTAAVPSLGRDRDDPYNIPRALTPRDNDSRGAYPNKMMQDPYQNQFRRN